VSELGSAAGGLLLGLPCTSSKLFGVYYLGNDDVSVQLDARKSDPARPEWLREDGVLAECKRDIEGLESGSRYLSRGY